MDLVGRHAGGGRGLERPRIIGLAAGPRRNAGIHLRAWPLGTQFSKLAFERGRDPGLDDTRGAGVPVSGDIGLMRAPGQAFDQPAAGHRAVERLDELLFGLVDQEGRRDQSLGRGVLHPPKLAAELHRIGFEPREIGLGIGGVLHRMIGVHEARDVEIGADILDHHVGRVAPSADGDIAIG